MTASQVTDSKLFSRGVKFNALGILGRSSRPIYLIVFSRLVAKESLGAYLLAYAICELVAKLALMGLDRGLLRQIGILRARGRSDEMLSLIHQVVLFAMGVAAIAAGLLWWFHAYLIDVWLAEPGVIAFVKVFCLGIPFYCAAYVLVMALRATMDMRYEAMIQSTGEPVVVLVVGLTLFIMGLGPESLAIAHVAAYITTSAVAYVYVRRVYVKSDSAITAVVDWQGLLKMCLPFGGTDVLNLIKSRLDFFFIGSVLPLPQTAIYGVVTEIGAGLRKLKAVFDPILMPVVQRPYEDRRYDEMASHINRAFGWALVPSLGFFGVLITAPAFCLGLFGTDYIVGRWALIVYCIGQLIYVIFGLLETVLVMTRYAYYALMHIVILIGLNFIGLYFLVPGWGIVGAAVATTIAAIVVEAIRLIQFRVLLKINPFSKNHIRPVFAFIIGLCASILVQTLWSHHQSQMIDGLFGACFLAVYIGALWLQKMSHDRSTPINA